MEDRESKEFRCPYCGRLFASRRGLKIHVSRTHAPASGLPAYPEELIRELEEEGQARYPDIM